ncbi:MAG: FKBP-type peptidyl-prolyl cis-trans isomerase [Methanomassiliicoccales archaeon]|nr:MAG: FKBP-type peptidyl-prolyl cis-trans isomerase [Methanomassiliicoccales archaeon]
MRLKDLKNDTMAISKTILALLIIVLLLASTSTAYVIVFDNDSSTVGNGDSITVNYYGTVNIQGVEKVFDTSMWEVALDNETYPKTAWFTMRSQSAYSGFTFTVGRGQTITGFDLGVRGMKEGQTKVIVIPPEQGYGLMDLSKVKSFDLHQTAPVFVETTISGFNSTFGSIPVTGLTLTHPTYKWPVTVLNVDSGNDRVLYQNAAVQGSEYKVYANNNPAISSGWNIRIDSVDSTVNNGEGLIEFTHLVTEEDSWNIRGYTGNNMFVLIDVDLETGKAAMNYNSPLMGLTLTFHVTVEKIK